MRIDTENAITATTAQTLHARDRARVTDPAARPPRWEDLPEDARRAKIRAIAPAISIAMPHLVTAAYRADAAVLADPDDSYFRFLTERLETLAQSYEAMAEPLTDPEH